MEWCLRFEVEVLVPYAMFNGVESHRESDNLIISVYRELGNSRSWFCALEDLICAQ